MAVRKLRGRYVIEFESRGNRVFRRLPTGATKAQAEEYELRLRRELIDQVHLGKTPTVLLSKAIQEWYDAEVKGRKDEKETKSKVGLVLPVIVGLYLTKAGIVEAARRVREMKRIKGKRGLDRPFAIATLNRRLSVLKGTATWAWKIQHWTPENLSPYVILSDKKKERVRDRTITQVEADRLIKAGRNAEARAFIALGVYGLMRQGEIMRAKPEDATNGLKLPKTKKGVPRVIPIVPQLKPHLKALPLTSHKRTLYDWFLEARDKVGLKGLVHHDLRRSGATILANKGVDRLVIAHVLGDSLAVADRVYMHILDPTVDKAVRKGFKPIKNPIRV